jgi:hypothetical protein
VVRPRFRDSPGSTPRYVRTPEELTAAYAEASGKLGAVITQENRLMQPVPFFPIKR